MEQLARQRSAQVAAWRADVASRPAGDWAQLQDVAVHTTGIGVRYWNGAHVTGPDPDLDAAAAWFAERGMPWGVLVPEELAFDPGTAQVTTQRVMLRELDHLPDLPDVELWWEDGDGAVAVQQAVFEEERTGDFVLPKLRNAACGLVTAYDDGPVSTATLVVADGVAAVYGVGTLASYRGRGLGRAVTLAVLHEAVRRGCDLAFLNPSDLGHGVYRGLGFEDAPGWRVHLSIPVRGSSS